MPPDTEEPASEESRPSQGHRAAAKPLDAAVSVRPAARVLRTIEPVPAWAACRWLNRCRSADILRAEWMELGLWSPPMWQALRLPRFGRRYPCEGCPIVTSREAS